MPRPLDTVLSDSVQVFHEKIQRRTHLLHILSGFAQNVWRVDPDHEVIFPEPLEKILGKALDNPSTNPDYIESLRRNIANSTYSQDMIQIFLGLPMEDVIKWITLDMQCSCTYSQLAKRFPESTPQIMQCLKFFHVVESARTMSDEEYFIDSSKASALKALDAHLFPDES